MQSISEQSLLHS